MATRVIILSSGSTWIVPQDWNSNNNTIHMIGAGGGSSGSFVSGSNRAGGAGGGGGGYTKIANFATIAGSSITYAIGTGGTAGTSNGNGGNGSATTFNSGAYSAGGGGGGTGSSTPTSVGGTGGIGSTYNGGSGGAGSLSTVAATGNGGGGGGGSAGPNGNGGNGGVGFASTTLTSIAGGGGGGSGGGTSGGAGSAAVGGTGGNNSSGTGGGASNTIGTNGGGGGGAGNGSNIAGQAGSVGSEIFNIVGSAGGSGGGQGSGAATVGISCGAGASGGGTGTGGVVVAGAAGAQGVIVIVYNSIRNVIFLTSGSTWTVPSDWSPSNNTIEAIGGGGGGGTSSIVGGGGGGAYTKLFNFAVYPGQVVNISIGNGGNAGSNGTDTWLNKTSNAAPTSVTDGLLAKAGLTSTTSAGGLGGAASTSIPSAPAFSGGAGGAFVIAGSYPAGGGAAGPDGAGGAGGIGYTVGGSGGGGGGGNNGTVGNTGTASAGGAGGAGGGASGGAGGNGGASGVAAGIGKTGTGGGGGGGSRDASGSGKAAPGGSGNYWIATSTTSQTVTISQASPGVCTVTAAPQHGTPVVFTTTGGLPTGLAAGTTYYVLSIYVGTATVSATTFNVSATLDGAAINTSSAGSGIHTATFTAIAGSGGGAGGGSSTGNSGGSTTVGGGGLYGAGGGNSNNNSPTVYGLGAKGVIVITYTPPPYATRLNTSGNLFTSGTLDEVTFPSYSYYFGGGTYLSAAPNPAAFDTTATWTLETWIYFNSISAGTTIIACGTINDAGLQVLVFSTIVRLQPTNGLSSIDISYNFSINTWYHIAITSTPSLISLFVNGIFISSTANPGSGYTSNGAYIGANATRTNSLTGYISQLRLTIGVALYTTNFKPVFPLGSTANTTLLTAQSGTFVDNGPLSIALTKSLTGTQVAFPTKSNVPSANAQITTQRITSSSNLQVSGIFDEVTINNSGVAQRLYPTGNLQIGGIFDEVTRPT